LQEIRFACVARNPRTGAFMSMVIVVGRVPQGMHAGVWQLLKKGEGGV